MNIIISNTSNLLIYEQIATQIKQMILTNELKEGDALPSMRLLAKELRISVITTKRAYEELEHDGFIVTATGRGSFVAEKNLEFVKEEHLRQIEQLMGEICDKSRLCGLSLSELLDMFETIYKGE